MREILFRGKRISNEEWVYGGITRRKHPNFSNVPYVICANNKDYFVDENTIGQYTGLKDKNGKRIFEGDILAIAKKSNGIGDYFNPPVPSGNVVVKWDLCEWMWETIRKDKRYIHFPDAWCHYECEVIGNIHDNPELLESEE